MGISTLLELVHRHDVPALKHLPNPVLGAVLTDYYSFQSGDWFLFRSDLDVHFEQLPGEGGDEEGDKEPDFPEIKPVERIADRLKRFDYTYLEDKSGRHNKYYEVFQSDRTGLVVWYGSIPGRMGCNGGDGFAKEDAKQSYDALVRSKLHKGYKRVPTPALRVAAQVAEKEAVSEGAPVAVAPMSRTEVGRLKKNTATALCAKLGIAVDAGATVADLKEAINAHFAAAANAAGAASDEADDAGDAWSYDSSAPTPLLNLPNELKFRILDLLSPRDAAQLCATCTTLRSALSSAPEWHHKFRATWPDAHPNRWDKLVTKFGTPKRAYCAQATFELVNQRNSRIDLDKSHQGIFFILAKHLGVPIQSPFDAELLDPLAEGEFIGNGAYGGYKVVKPSVTAHLADQICGISDDDFRATFTANLAAVSQGYGAPDIDYCLHHFWVLRAFLHSARKTQRGVVAYCW